MHKAKVTTPTDDMINNVLLELKDLFKEQDKDLADYIGKENMPVDQPKEKSDPQEYQSEVQYDHEIELEQAQKNKDCLNEGQNLFVETILNAANSTDPENQPNVYAVEAYGGTGKTFCIGTICSELRGQGNIVLVMAISAQAATLLSGGMYVVYVLYYGTIFFYFYLIF